MEEQKQVSNNEILEVVKTLQSDISDIKSKMVTKDEFGEAISQMVTKDVFERSINDLSESISFIAENAVTQEQLHRVKQEITSEIKEDFNVKFAEIKEDFNAKITDSQNKLFKYLGEQFEYFKGDNFVAPIRGLNDKNDLTVVKLEQKKVFTRNDREEITDIPVFIRPKTI